MTAERKKLRFAPIIRVSTEAQEKKGVSLDLQQNQIKEIVKLRDDTIPKHCWQYCGQEHATPDQERKLFEKMLTDCEDDLFDAVIFAEFSRWARDQEAHARAIKILQKNGKRLFMGPMEFDLNDPKAKRMAGYAVVDAESTAGDMLKSSVLGKINIAKRGFPINGKLLFGRRLVNPEDKSDKNKKAVYEIIPKDQKFIQKFADRYIVGESLEKLADEAGMHLTTLRTILTKTSGPKWQRSFTCKQFGIKEKFETKIAELLDEETRKKIEKRVQRNKTVDRNFIKHKYLLKSLIRCGYCGRPFYGKTDKNGQVFYIHNKPKCGKLNSIKANRLELPVQAHVFSVTYDSKAADRAIKLAIPNPKERKKLTADLKREERKLSKLEKEKSRLLGSIRHGAISNDDAAEDMEDIKEQTLEAKNMIKQIEYKLNKMPNPDDKMTKIQMDTLQQIIRSTHRDPSRILDMSFDKKRELLTEVFDGENYGIYLYKDDTKPNAYTFKLKWIFKFDEIDRVPMPNGQIMELLNLDKNEYAKLLKADKLTFSFA